MSNCKEKESEEMRLLFKIYIEDLRYCKKQQWYTLYLMLIGIGGLMTVGINIPECSNKLFKIVPLIICSWFIFFIGWYFLYEYYGSIKEFRKKKGEIAETFEPNVRRISGIPKEDEGSDERDLNITKVFVVVGFVAAVLATFVIWRA